MLQKKSPTIIIQYIAITVALIIYFTSCFSFLINNCDGLQGAPQGLSLVFLIIIIICTTLRRSVVGLSTRLGYIVNENEKKINFIDWLVFYISSLYIIFWIIDKISGGYSFIAGLEYLIGGWSILLLTLFIFLLFNSIRRFKKRYYSLKKINSPDTNLQ